MKNDYEVMREDTFSRTVVTGKNFCPQSSSFSGRYLSWSLQLVMMLSFMFMGLQGTAQTVLINPAAEGGFENGATFAANGWTVANGANNQWFVGPVAASGALTGNVAYVSSSTTGATHAYSVSSPSSNFFYRDVTVPAGQTKIVLQFNWYGQGESTYDMWQVFIAPTTVTPVGSASFPGNGASNLPPGLEAATFLGNGNLQGSPQLATFTIPSSFAGTTFRLIFYWKSDTSGGSQPPAAIDNISLKSGIPGNFVSIASGDYGSPSTWDANWVPTINDNVTISAGHTVNLEGTHAANNLTVNGTLGFGASAASLTVNSNLSVNTGAVVNVFSGTTGKTLTVGGNLTNNGSVNVSVGATSAGSLIFNGSTVQTISGTGTFANNLIRNLTFSNTSTAIPNINWLVDNISVEYNLNIANAKINLGSNKLTYGISATSSGSTFTTTNGGFMPGGKFSRWWSATATGYTTLNPTSVATGTAGRYPFYTPEGQQRIFYIGRTTPNSTTGGGQYSVVYNHASTVTSGLNIDDNGYVVTDRWNGNFVVSTEGTSPVVASYVATIFAPGAYNAGNANSRIIAQSAAIGGTHQATSTLPSAQRSGVSLADLTTASGLYMGLNANDVVVQAVANGNWNSPSTWSTGVVPSCVNYVAIPTGITVTVDSAGNVSRNLTIATGATLNITAGDLVVGCTLFNNAFVNNGTLTVSGGTLTVNGSMIHSTGSTFNQSGGAIVVDGNDAGVAANSVSGAIVGLNTNLLNWTGGTLTIVDPHANTSGSTTLSYSSSLNVDIPAGHTLIFGNGTSTDAGGYAPYGFRLNTWVGSGRITFGNVVVNGGSAATRLVTSAYEFGINGNLTINAGSEYRPGTSTYVAGNVVNNGIYTNTATLYMGTYLAATAGATANAQTISGTGTFANAATTPSANMVSLAVNNTNAAGVTLGIPVTLSGTLNLVSGKLNTSAANMLTVGTATAAGTVNFPATGIAWVNGPLTRTIASGNANTNYIAFPVGKSVFSPIWLAPATTAVSVFRAEAFDSNTGTADASIINLTANRRWEAPIISGTVTNIKVRLGDAGIVATNIPVMAPAAAGVYTAAFGSVATYTAGTPNTTQSNIAVASANYTGFLSYADSNACAGVPNPGNTLATATTICGGTPVTFTVQNGTTGSGVTYQWQSSVNGTDFTNIDTATNNTFVTTPTASLYYRLKVTCATGPDTAYSVPVQVSFANAVTASTPASRCGAGALTLAATPSAGATIAWYDAATGGTLLTTGSTYTTPVINATTTYYATAQAPVTGTAAVGTATTTTSGNSITPFTSNYEGSRIQYLVRANELRASGLLAGPLTSLAFQVSSAGAYTQTGYTIKIASTSATSLSGFLAESFSTVYGPVVLPIPTTGLNTFNFAAPFVWDGQSNIVVEICHDNDSADNTCAGCYGANSAVRYTTTSFNSVYGRYADNNSLCGTTNGTAISTFNQRPNIIFGGQVACSSAMVPVVATITPPPALTLSTGTTVICVGQTTAPVTLTAGATDYDNYVWTPSAGVTGSPSTGWTFNPAATTTYTLNATQSSGAMCVANAATIVVTVNPLPTPLTISSSANGNVCLDNVVTLTANGGLYSTTIFNESFDAASSQFSTTAISGTPEATLNTTYYAQGTGSVLFKTSSIQADISYRLNNNINLSTYTSAQLTFSHIAAMEESSTAYDFGYVEYSTDGGTTWVTFPASSYAGNGSLLSTTSSPASSVVFSTKSYADWVARFTGPSSTPGTGPAASLWKTETINIPASALSSSQFRIRFRYTTDSTTNYYGWLIDNVAITAQMPNITWAPATNLYTDAAATVPYTAGTSAAKVYAKSSVAATTVYTATASTPANCSITATATVNIVNCAIDFANLQSPQTGTITTCGSQVVYGQVFKTGVTEAAGAGTGIQAWVGVSSENTDPSTWAATSWHLATFNVQSGNNDEFMYTISGLPAGTYYYATRFQYLNGAYAYGGLGGLWSTANGSGVLTVNAVTAPTATDLVFCNANPTVANLTATATGTLNWYTTATGGTALATTAAVVTGTYYVSQTISGCEGPRTAIQVTVNTTAVPAASNLTFCNESPTVANLTATGTNLQWYAAATGGSALANTVALTNGTTYYVSQTINGCESTRAAVVVTINNTAAPTASNMTFCNANPTVADLSATGVALQWYADATGGSALANTVALTNGNTYYVSQTINGCESARTAVTVTLNTTAAPTASDLTFCNVAPTVANLTATGTNLQWYAAATGGSALANTVALTNGTYFVSQTINGCESARTAVVVTINNTAAPTASNMTFCNASPTVADLSATGVALQWYADATGGSALANTVALTNGTTYYVSQTINGCESARTAVTVTLNNTAAPTASDMTFCNDSPTVADLVATGTGTFQWYAAATGGSALANTVALTNGTYYVSQTINGCESARTAMVVTINNTAAPTASDMTFCNESPTVADLSATGVALQWYTDATGGSALANTVALTNGTTYYVSQTINGCEGPRAAVNVTINTTAAPVANAAQTFCAGATVAQLDVTGTGTQWYGAATGGSALANTAALTNGTYYVSQTINGCESARIPVAVTVNTVTVDEIADQNVCSSYILPVLTNGNYFTAPNGGGTALTAGQAIDATSTVYIFAQTGDCTAESSFVVTVAPLAAPTGEATQAITVTDFADATIEDIDVDAEGTLTWYATEADALAGNNAIPSTTQLVNGEDYFVTQTVGACTSAPFAVTVSVTLGKEDFVFDSIKFYPNPVINKLTVSYSSNITNVEVYNLLGQLVIATQPNATTAEINMERLEAATYIVRVTADSKTKEIKVVKQQL